MASKLANPTDTELTLIFEEDELPSLLSNDNVDYINGIDKNEPKALHNLDKAL